MMQARELLHTDFDGAPLADPDALIGAGLDDPRHRERVPGLTALLDDGSADPEDRLLACIALATWGERAGYAAIVAAATDPTQPAWHDESIDRMYSVDNTFGLLAAAVRDSDEMAETKGTNSDRLAALCALVSRADRAYFDGQLDWAVAADPVPTVVTAVKDVVGRGIDRLARRERPPFDLGAQLVDLATALVDHDVELAVELAMAVLTTAGTTRAARHAADIVASATGEPVDFLADYLRTTGDVQVRKAVADALGRRR